MLLLLLFARFSQAYVLNLRAEAYSCDDINNCRRLFDIVWGCLTTVFACTWVSVHPNVPPPNQSWLSLMGRRLRMMVIAIIAPEVMVGFAARQFFAARFLSKKFDLSITHGSFLSMGGFVLRNGHHPIATRKQLEDPLLGPKYLSAIRDVKVADIMDKSKGDALSKGVALAQGLWFTIQFLARVVQRLPVTELEVATLAFAIVNVFIWLLWWEKPLDVQEPILIGPAGDPADNEPELNCVPMLTRFFSVLTGYSRYPYKPTSSNSVPSFWSMQITEEKYIVFSISIECLMGTVFGVIHCAAWNADFLSADEMWMWRSCSLLVAAIPAVIVSFSAPDLVIGNALKLQSVTFSAPTLLAIVCMVVIPIYIVSRVFLIVLAFTALRALPPGALVDMNWSVYIPHL
ncbi:hypothetical protein DFH07DRAFT_990698 [Mycena maculata]|uniref:Uncharacterized protein n=1 Tax=Mycena maculata TaxID=230809 RepID=A0AAD7I105_9AGAR|nr:hypothetical protein DFH07DRAFT_990698 [Mycena maculata]